MRALSWTTCLWPGLAALWLRGSWRGLVAAVAFTLTLVFALIATFAASLLPVGLPPSATATMAWVLVLGFWILGVRSGRQCLARPLLIVENNDPAADAWLSEAQTLYLKGHWIEAETLLNRLLARSEGDVEARLLLTSIERRTNRLAEARRTLAELARSESAAHWTMEIQAELARIQTTENEVSQQPGDPSDLPLARAA